MTREKVEETMNDQSDTQALLVRAQLVAQQMRRSEAYPALIGGVAGGIAGALMAALIAGRITARPAEDAPRLKEPTSGWSLREVMQLATIAASLLKQIQSWIKEQSRK